MTIPDVGNERDSGQRCAQCRRSTVLSSTLLCSQYDESGWLPRLRSGQLPSDAERASIDAELAALRAAAEAHEQELARVRARLATLQERIDRRACFLHSPVRSMPDELMEEILLLLWYSREWGDDEKQILIKEDGTTDIPALLPSRTFAPPHVCAWWRSLALARPSLRPYIYITRELLMPISPGYRESFPERLRQSLACLPPPAFNIHISHTDIYPELAPALDGQSLHVHRWMRALLHNLPWTVLRELATSHLAHLRYMHIDMGATDEWKSGPWSSLELGDRPLFFGDAPQLAEVSLEAPVRGAVAFSLQRLPFTLPWSQLRSFSASNCPLRICLELLSQCTALHSMRWWDERTDEVIKQQDVAPAQRINAYIKNLTLRPNIESKALRNLLDFSNMPHLSSLQLHYVLSEHLLPWLERSGCRLTSLTLIVSVCWMSASDITDVLKAAPELEYLAFHYDPQTGQGLDAVTEGETMDSFLVALRDALHATEDFGQPQGSQRFPDVSPHLYLQRLRTLSIKCEERCFDRVYECMLREWPPGGAPTRNFREVWLATPLSPKDIRDMERLGREMHLEIYGLDKCAALYDALLPYDWEPPILSSRCVDLTQVKAHCISPARLASQKGRSKPLPVVTVYAYICISK
ncbi:hypothetical protein GGG16DRAFT_46316 [Schizophyllum commune]